METRIPPRQLLAAVAVAVGLTVVFWRPLWQGGGFIGGDVYTYYMPQKAFYAERLHAGELPLWNSWTGHGYPLVAESQTAAFYPPNLLLYRLLDVNTAYNVNHLLHYVLTFLFTWMYARSLRFGMGGAVMTALVYTYGWFPPRSCLEWAVIGGMYLPLALWCVESFLQSPRWRYLFALTTALGLQLLAGHFNLAFITLLVLAAYAPLRLSWTAADLPPETVERKRRCLTALAACIGFAYLLAAVQLIPTWELRQHSQRSSVEGQYDPGYGHIPPIYLTQIVAPWMWYAPDIDIDQALGQMRVLAIPSATNKVEAHLYFGVMPLLLVVWGFVGPRFGFPRYTRLVWIWVWFGTAALIYATGWPLVLMRCLPGFGYFTGPGRYGIVTTLAAALMAGFVADAYLKQRAGTTRTVWIAALFAATAADLWLVSRLVTYTFLVEPPPVFARNDSEVRRLALADSPHPRLYAPGQNLPNLLGVACTPVYLGLGPAEYYELVPDLPSLSGLSGDEPVAGSAEQIDWLRRAGVTHVLSQKPLDLATWPAELRFGGADPLLNPAWARPYYEPLFLYRLEGSRGRAAFADPATDGTVAVAEYRANRVSLQVECAQASRVVLTDLMSPGWQVHVDGKQAQPIRFEGMYRAVDVPIGKHTVVWSYRPASVYWGAAVSGVALLMLLVTTASLRRRRES